MKKFIKIITIIIFVLIILWLITFCIDFYRCNHLKEPIFIISKFSKDIVFSNGREDFSFLCLGYRVEISILPISKYEKEVSRIEMYLFDNCILNLYNNKNGNLIYN